MRNWWSVGNLGGNIHILFFQGLAERAWVLVDRLLRVDRKRSVISWSITIEIPLDFKEIKPVNPKGN